MSVTVAISIIVAATVTINYKSATGDNGSYYPPMTTHIVPAVSNFTAFFCQRLKVTLTVGRDLEIGFPQDFNISFYLLDSSPKLTGHEKFNTSATNLGIPMVIAEGPFVFILRYYHYYLYAGSAFHVSACIVDPMLHDHNQHNVSIYLIKGRNEDVVMIPSWSRQPWMYKPDGRNAVFAITATCNDSNDTYSHQVTSDDYYYLLFVTNSSIADGSTINISVSYDFFHLEPSHKQSIISSCFINSRFWDYHRLQGSCSVDLPMHSTPAYLSTFQRSRELDYQEPDDSLITFSCVPRIWLYAVISVGIFICTIAVASVISLIICACKRKKTAESMESDPLLPGPVSPGTIYGSSLNQ